MQKALCLIRRMESQQPAQQPAPDNPERLRHLVLVLAAAALFWLLREAYGLFMPLVTALLLALAVWPLVAAIRDKVPSWLGWTGPLAGALLVLTILAAFFTGVGFAARSVYALSAEVGPQLGERLGDLPFELPEILPLGSDPGSEGMAIGQELASAALMALNMTASMVFGLLLVLFLLLLMLAEAPAWRAKLDTITQAREGARTWLRIGQAVGVKLRSYFTARLLIGVVGGVLYGGFLFLTGVEYALLWGTLAILLSFIPTIGSIISGVLPTIYVFATSDFGDAVVVGAGLLVIEQVLGNFLDPKLMGRQLAISPLVVLLALVLWTLLWGLAGALLAVPIIVLLTVAMAQFDHLKPAALLMTQCEDWGELENYAGAQ